MDKQKNINRRRRSHSSRAVSERHESAADGNRITNTRAANDERATSEHRVSEQGHALAVAVLFERDATGSCALRRQPTHGIDGVPQWKSLIENVKAHRLYAAPLLKMYQALESPIDVSSPKRRLMQPQLYTHRIV